MSYSVIVLVVILMFLELESVVVLYVFFVFQAEDGIRDLVRSRGLGDVYKRQDMISTYLSAGNSWMPQVTKSTSVCGSDMSASPMDW